MMFVQEAELTDVSLYWNASTNDLMAELAPDEVVVSVWMCTMIGCNIGHIKFCTLLVCLFLNGLI